MRRTIYINKIRKSFLTLCLMVTATMAWAVDVSTEAELRTHVTSGATEMNVKLTQNIALTSTLDITRSVTIDLNGYTISAGNFRAIHIKTGNVEFTSDKPGAAITVTGAIPAEYSVMRVGNNEGTLIPVSLTIGQNVTVYTDADKCYGITVFGNRTTETLVVNGTIHTNNRPAISGNGSAGYGNTTITIGENATITTTNEVAIYHPQDGTLTVNGTVTGAGGIEMKGGQLIVGADAHITATAQPSQTPNNNGTSTRGYAVAIVESNGGYAGVSAVNISADADINGPIAMLVDSEHTGVTPPTFDQSGVQMNVSVTKDGDVKKYASLLDAVNEAPAGATIRLLNDINLTQVAIIDKVNITINLNGKSITVTGDHALWVKNPGASITGTGIISATGIVNPDWSVIQVGTETANAAGLTIGSGVTITTDDCYGITTIGTGASSLTIDGRVTTNVRPAVVSTNNFTTAIGSTAVITTSNEVAVYATGGNLSVSGNVTGLSAVEAKGGTLTIDGATLTATGTPSHTANNNGTSTRGYAVAIVKNTNFPGVTAATFSNDPTITGPVATLIDSGTAADPTFTGITMLADISGEHYSSVIDATNIVPNDGTVKLMQNLALTAPLALDRHATYKLDLVGHSITATDCNAITIKSGDVIITNTGAVATISSTGTVASTDAVIRLGDDDGENRNISLGINENVTVSTTACHGVLLSGTNTREALTVKGTISTAGQPAIAGDKANGGTIINIEENANITSTGNVAIYHPQTGTLTVEGIADHNAVVSGTTGIEMKAGDLIVGAHATITGSAGSATHTANNAGPSTSGYGIAIVENANFEGVGNVDIETTEHITAPVSIAMLVDNPHSGVAEPEFIGNVMLVAEVTGTNTDKYAKLDDAIKQAQATNTVKMLEDANIASALVVDKNITFDLNDYTITSTATSDYVITSSANATIKNGGIIANECGGIQSTAGTLTLEKMNVKAKGNSLNLAGAIATIDATSILTSTTNETVAMGNGTTLTVDGKIYNTTTNAIAATGSVTGLTINTGVIVSTASGNAVDWHAIGTLTIEGGQINGTTNALYANKGTVAITGGTFTGTTNALTVVNEAASDCTISIEHGTFNCGTGEPIVSSGTNARTKFVKGDYFSKQIPQNLCVDGYMISSGTNSNGMYYLVSELVITDATSWTKPTIAYTIHTAKYVRNSGMGTAKFGTLCLPFSFTPGDSKTTIPTGMKFYMVNRIESSILYLDELSGMIDAGTPVIFHRTGSETTFTIESDEANIPDVDPATANGLVGTFTTDTIKTELGSKYYLNGDFFHQATESLTIPAFRAYIQITSGTSAPPRLTIQTEDMQTGLEDTMLPLDNIFSEDGLEAVYDLQGRKLNSLQQGVNIIRTQNGKTIKVFLRGEL